MDRNRERAEALTMIGLIVDPVLAVLREPETFGRDERTRVLARYFNEAPKLLAAVKAFTIGEAGYNYESHWLQLHRDHHAILNHMTSSGSDAALAVVEEARGRMIGTLLEIPVDVDATIHESKTPFTTYCFLRDLLVTTRERVWWFDRYFDPDVFPLFLRNVPNSAEVVMVSWPESKLNGKKAKTRHAAFRAVSKLYAQERGEHSYRMIEAEDFHDRWFRCDDKLLVLGGSISSLGGASSFSVSKLDSTPANFDQMEAEVQSGTEVFGPSSPAHP